MPAIPHGQALVGFGRSLEGRRVGRYVVMMAASPITTVLLSGGIDSMVVLHLLQLHGHLTRAMFIHYGQAAASAERSASTNIARRFAANWSEIEVSGGAGFLEGEIPYRNAFLVFAAAMHMTSASEAIALGIHAGVPYPDCGPSFVDTTQNLLNVSANPKALHAPLLSWSKAEVLAYAISERLPVELTHSCEASSVPCGACLSCLDRQGL